MATILKIKRSTASGTSAPGSLSAGELAISYGTGTSGNNGQRLFVGDHDGNSVLVIGGEYFANLNDHTLGSLTASSAVLVDSNSAISTMKIGNSTTVGGSIELQEGTNNGAHSISLKSPNSVASDLVLTLPGADGSAGQPLVTDGSGTLSFGTISTALNIAADSGSADGVSTEETITFEGGTGIDTTVTNNKISTAIDSTVVTKTGAHTLTNKTLASPVFTTQFSIGSAVITEAELEMLDTITAGTAAASKALVVDSSKDIAGIRNIGNTGTITTTGIITAGGFTIGSATMVEADLEQVEDITAGTAAASKALVVDANKDIGTLRNITSDGSFSAASGTFTGNIVIGNGAYIGATNDTDAIQIEGDGDVVFSQDVAVSGTHTVTGTSTMNGSVTLGNASGDVITVTGTAGFTQAPTFNGGFNVAAGQTIDFNANRLTEVADPTQAQDAATKAYVDAVKSGLNVKDSVKVASAAALAASTYSNGSSGVGATLTANANGALTIDGVNSGLATQRVLIKDQTDASHNGVYTVTNAGSGAAAFVLTRATDADTGAELTGGTFVFAEEGTANADNGFVFTHSGTPTMGTTDLTVSQFSGAGQITAGSALTKSGNTLNVGVDDSSIEINSDAVRVKASGITNAMLAGSIDLTAKVTGILPVANGGTGASSLTANRMLMANGTGAITVLGAGTAGQVMTSNGASAPAFGDVDGGTY
tara:strand:- start:256 stop:2382 length:2127 start_codon:yes stop_codon:yes gene_type:complete